MKNELRNINISILSLVDKGANQKTIIWKSDSNTKFVHESYISPLIPILKTDDEKKIVYGIVYSPNEVDSHGDFATSDEIEKACYLFMKNCRNTNVDKQHDLDTNKNCYVGENWIVKTNDALFPEDIGAWATGIKVEDDEIWEQVKKGEITGISMYGVAERIQKADDEEKSDSNFLRRMRKFFDNDENEVAKDFNEQLALLDFPKLLDAFYGAVMNILYDEDIPDKAGAVTESLEQFRSKLEDMKVAKGIVEKAGKMISESNMTKLQNAIDSIQSIINAANKSTEKSFKKNKPGDSEMTNEEIQKAIADALDPVSKANDDLKKENADLKKRLDDVEKQSKGSKQVTDTETEPAKEKVSKAFNWLGN